MKFSQRDLLYSVITGLATGLIAWRIFNFLDIPQFYGFSFAWLVVVVPVLWIVGVNFGYFLARWFSFFNQFGKYAAIGFTNAAVDFGVLNLLIGLSGIAAGLHYSFFKTTSFVVAVLHSYFWNKYWTFESTDSNQAKGEFAKFILVNIIVAVINIGVASFVVNQVHPVLGLEPKTWANIGAVIGSAVGLVFNFIGFRFIVFKKNVSSTIS